MTYNKYLMNTTSIKKRVGILSFHRIWNAGAFFVVLSLYEKLKETGYDPVVIDYQPGAITNQLKFNLGENLPENLSNLKGVIYNRRMHRIYGLVQKDFKISPLIQNGDQINQLNLDCIITSADIWNYDSKWCNNEHIFSGKYLESIPLIGYGVSLGVTNFRKSTPSSEMLNYMQNYDYIFPRDSQTMEFCTHYLNNGGTRVLDAAFMLKISDYSEKRIIKSPYLAVYMKKEFLTERIKNEIKKFADKKNLKIVAPAYKNTFADMSLPYINPYEWLNIMFNADYIFSGTFHGTVFSLLLNKPFTTVLHEGIRLKTETMLNDYNMTNHIYNEGSLSDILEVKSEGEINFSHLSSEQFASVVDIINRI